ncbi:MAG: hypothetical protein SGI77_25125 [Pirellulaceae bacterium]|nr:hypothetical protein [Pirellulaceae bacterium]
MLYGQCKFFYAKQKAQEILTQFASIRVIANEMVVESSQWLDREKLTNNAALAAMVTIAKKRRIFLIFLLTRVQLLV